MAQAVTVKEEEGVVDRVGETDWLRLRVEHEQGVEDAEKEGEEEGELLGVEDTLLVEDCVRKNTVDVG